MKHDFVLDAEGKVEYFEQSDFHGGPHCKRCDEFFCEHCNPECFTDDCPAAPAVDPETEEGDRG